MRTNTVHSADAQAKACRELGRWIELEERHPQYRPYQEFESWDRLAAIDRFQKQSMHYYVESAYDGNNLAESQKLAAGLLRRQILLRGILYPAREAWKIENALHGRPVMPAERLAKGMRVALMNQIVKLPEEKEEFYENFTLGSPERVYARYQMAMRAFRLAVADRNTFGPSQPLVTPGEDTISPWYPAVRDLPPDWLV